jgi:hypothetical protein
MNNQVKHVNKYRDRKYLWMRNASDVFLACHTCSKQDLTDSASWMGDIPFSHSYTVSTIWSIGSERRSLAEIIKNTPKKFWITYASKVSSQASSVLIVSHCYKLGKISSFNWILSTSSIKMSLVLFPWF